jgi:acyl carrier protein
MPNILTRLTDVFHEVFDDDGLQLTRGTSATDVERWDSLMHVTLMLATEREFGIRFSSTEVAQLQDVGELLDLIHVKAGNASHKF